MRSFFAIFYILGFLLISNSCSSDVKSFDPSKVKFTPSENKEWHIKPGAVNNLFALKSEIKFQYEDTSKAFPKGYRGLRPIENIPFANNQLNKSIDKLIQVIELNKKPQKDKLLNEIERAQRKLYELVSDSIDRARVDLYFTEIRKMIGII